MPYSLRPEICTTISQDQFPKVWGGAPTIAILKAFQSALQPCSSMPAGLRASLAELSDLYSRPAPPINSKDEALNHEDSAEDGKGGGKKKGGGNNKNKHGGREEDPDSGKSKGTKKRGNTKPPANSEPLSKRQTRSSARKAATIKKKNRAPPPKRNTRNSTRKTVDNTKEDDIPPVLPSNPAGSRVIVASTPLNTQHMWGPEYTVNQILRESRAFTQRTPR